MAEFSTTSPEIAENGMTITPIWTTLITQNDSKFVSEQRKAKQVFPKYDVKLKYPDAITPSDIQAIFDFYMARKGAYESFYIYDKTSRNHTKQYVDYGDSTTTIFDIPGKTTSSVSIYIDDVLQVGGYSIVSGTGTVSSDRVQFNAAPVTGQLITVSFTGYLRIRARFKDDRWSIAHLTQLLYLGGEIEFIGLAAEDT